MKIGARTTAILAVLFVVVASNAELVEIPRGQSKWSGHLRPGIPLEVKGGLGDIDIVASTGDAFTVTVDRKTEPGTQPRLFVDEQRALVCLDWTSPDASTRCGTGRLLTGSIKNDAAVNLRLAVPTGTDVMVQADTGRIHVAPLKSSVTAKTYYGDLAATADGPKTDLETLRGTTQLYIADEALEQKIHASVTGDIFVILPETRRVGYHIYASGNEIRSAYELEGLSPAKKRNESAPERSYRKLTKDQYSGVIDNSTGPWVHLEIFEHGSGHLINISKN